MRFLDSKIRQRFADSRLNPHDSRIRRWIRRFTLNSHESSNLTRITPNPQISHDSPKSHFYAKIRAKIFQEGFRINPLSKSDKIFLIAAFILCAALCAFTFWLGFPGHLNVADTPALIALRLDNWYPVFIAYVLKAFYAAFGYHSFYLFLFNIVPFYLAIFALIAGFYLRFRTKWALLCVLITLIGNFYFQNFSTYDSFSLTALLFLEYALLFFLTIARLRSKIALRVLWGVFFVVAFFAILWRHNAIFSVFPAFFCVIYLWLLNRGLDGKRFARFYAIFLAFSALACVLIVIFVPKFLKRGEAYPANQMFLAQIAGACVPARDAACFLDEWYAPNRDFSDVTNLYTKNPTFSDELVVYWRAYGAFAYKKLPHLQRKWAEAIWKYPANFAAHWARYARGMIFQTPRWESGWIYDSHSIQKKAENAWFAAHFPPNELKITFSPLREKIYEFLYDHRIMLNHAVAVFSSALLLLISSVLLAFKRFRSEMLVFTFATSFAGFFSAVFITLFALSLYMRYMSPIFALSIAALCGFVAVLGEIIRSR